MSHYFSVLSTLWNYFDFQGLPLNFEIFPTFDVLTTPLIGPGPTFYCCLIWQAPLINFTWVNLATLCPIKTTYYHNRAPSETFLEAEFFFFSGGHYFDMDSTMLLRQILLSFI